MLPLHTNYALPADLAQVEMVVRTLLASRDVPTLAGVINGLQPAVLADLVLKNLMPLPAHPHALRLDDVQPLEPWLVELGSLLAAPHMAGGVLPAQQQQPGQQQPWAAWGPATQGPHAQQPAQAAIRAQPGTSTAAAATAAAAAAGAEEGGGHKLVPKKLKAPAAPVIVPQPLEAARLTPQQLTAMRREAVMRILRTENPPSPLLQRALLARLLAAAGPEDGTEDAVLQHILADFHARNGFEIAMQWLHVLFLGGCRSTDPSHSQPLDAPGAAGRPDGEVDLAGMGEGSSGAGPSAGAAPAERVKEEPGGDVDGSWGGGGSAAAAAGEGGAATQAAVAGTPPPAILTPAADFMGSKYEAVLIALLEGLQEALPPSDKTLIR